MKIVTTFLVGGTLAIGAIVGLAPAGQAAAINPTPPVIGPPITITTIPPITCAIKVCLPPVRIDPCARNPELCKLPTPPTPTTPDPKTPGTPPTVDIPVKGKPVFTG